MNRFLVTGAILLILALFGCNSSEEKKTTPEAKEPVTEKVVEAAKATAAGVQEAAQAGADKTAEIGKQAEPAIKETAKEAGEMAATGVEKAEEMATQAADTVAEKATAAAAATTTAAGQAVEKAKQMVSPDSIVLKASFGDVTFPHGMHSKAYQCSTCHGEGTPGRFGINKEKAHALCKDCHKKEGAGPTGCTGCHKK